jgi:hypothetical protein
MTCTLPCGGAKAASSSHDEMRKDIERDKAANEQGINAATEESCEQGCISLLNGLPENRRQFMEDYFKR